MLHFHAFEVVVDAFVPSLDVLILPEIRGNYLSTISRVSYSSCGSVVKIVSPGPLIMRGMLARK